MTAPSPTAPSVVARLAAQAARLEAATFAVTGRLPAALPGLDAEEAAAALVLAVPIPVRGAARYLEELAEHLADHPQALTSGSSLCPPVVLRLTQVLHEGGHRVVRPGCAHCGTVRTDLRQLRPEGRLCATCDAKSRRATCARCHREGMRIWPAAPRAASARPATTRTPPAWKSAPSAANSRTRSSAETTAVACARAAGNAPPTPA